MNATGADAVPCMCSTHPSLFRCFLVVHRALPDLHRMKHWHLVTITSEPLSLFLPRTPLGIRHIDHVVNTDESLHAPHFLDLEVLQVIRRLTLADDLDMQRSVAALKALIDLPLVRHEHMPLLHRIWELRAAMTAYDAAYVALAEGLSAVLLTCDGRLARAHGHRARVNLLT